jgi:hypothetical protein
LDDGHDRIYTSNALQTSHAASHDSDLSDISVYFVGTDETSKLVRGCQVLEHFLGYSLKKFYEIETSYEG